MKIEYKLSVSGRTYGGCDLDNDPLFAVEVETTPLEWTEWKVDAASGGGVKYRMRDYKRVWKIVGLNWSTLARATDLKSSCLAMSRNSAVHWSRPGMIFARTASRITDLAGSTDRDSIAVGAAVIEHGIRGLWPPFF
ncbi:MAG: hypothetical protein KatS3mg109_0112 [Pirellulaceae bacterium]|nr:MAG: hypothetical protein KatS3mg109_0112 [Pirellulaceae bacterium]